MRQPATFLTVLLLAIFLPGCPYDSNVPLGTPQPHDIDSRVTGYWVLDDPDDKANQMLLSIQPFNASEYVVEITMNDKGTPQRYRAFPVRIGDQTYWNINSIESSFPPSRYMLARSAFVVDDQLSILVVGKKTIPVGLASDAPGLLSYLRSHSADPSLYDGDALVLRRPKAGEIEWGRLRNRTAS